MKDFGVPFDPAVNFIRVSFCQCSLLLNILYLPRSQNPKGHLKTSWLDCPLDKDSKQTGGDETGRLESCKTDSVPGLWPEP